MSGPGSEDSKGSISLLHVDDDADGLALTKMYLEEIDPSLSIVSVDSPRKALDMLRHQSFECVLSDYLMPDIDGIQLCIKVRELQNDIPFIIFTGRGSEEVAEKAFAAGVNDYIRKEESSSNYLVLAQRIRHAVERHRVEDLYRTLVEDNRDAFAIIQGTAFKYVNQAMADLLGVKGPEELIEAEILPWVADEDREMIRERTLRRQNGEPEPRVYEYSIVRADGERRQVEVSVSLVNYRGKPASIVFNRDVTERKRVEAEHEVLMVLGDIAKKDAEDARAELDVMLERASDAFVALDNEWRYSYVNAAALANLRKTREELIGRSMWEVFPDAVGSIFWEKYHEAMEQQKPVEFDGHYEGYDIWMHVHAYPSREGLTIYYQDVTQRRRAESQLRKIEDRYRSLFVNMIDGFALLKEVNDDASGPMDFVLLEVNDAFERITGLEREKIIGRRVTEILPGIHDSIAGWVDNYGKVEYMEGGLSFEGYLEQLDRWLSISVYSPEIGYFAAVFEDITERKRAEEALRASEERLRFALMREGLFQPDKEGELRRTGIELIGDVPWGTHFCQFYQTKEDLVDILVPYFKAGLENNEFCMWVTADPLNEEEAANAMEKALPNFSKYLKQGQIEILSYKDWYVKDGGFDADKVLSGWVSKLEDALKKGYSGLRLTGNTFWLERNGWKAFTDYEEMVNSVIGKYKMIAICTYFLDKCNANEIIDVVKNHQFAVIKRSGIWELIEGSEYKKMGNALLVSEERYRTLFDRMNEGFALHEIICNDEDEPIDYRFLEINPAFEQLTGLKRRDVLGKTVQEVLPGIEPEWIKIYGEVALTGKPANFENYSGELKRHYQVYAFSPASRHFAVLFTDITERKRAERALLRAKDDWERTFESVPDMIAILDNEHRIVRANRAMTRRLGVTPEQCIGLNCYKCVHGTSAPPEFCPHALTLKDGKEHVAEVHEESLGGDFIVSTTPLFDDQGQMIGSVHVARDITERKRTEEALLESESRMGRAQEIAHLGSWELDLLSDHLTWSDEVYRIFGLQPQEFGATYEAFLEAVHPDDRAAVDAAYAGSLSEGRDGYEIDHRVVRKPTGEIRIVHEKCEHIRDESGKIIRSIGMVHDITEQKRAEEELRFTKANLETFAKELSRANDMLTEGNDELGRLNDDLSNLIESVNIPIVIVDNELNIKRVSPSTENVLRILKSDVGRPIGHLRPRVEIPNLKELIHEATQALTSQEVEARDRDGRWYKVSVRPYRTRENRIEGAVLAYFEISDQVEARLKIAEYASKLEEMVEERTREIYETKERLEAFMESQSDPFVIWDQNLNLVQANNAMLKFFPPGKRMEDLIGKNMKDIAPGVENRERYSKFLQVLETGEPAFLRDVPSLTSYGDRLYDVKIFRLKEGIGVVNFDVTERVRMEEKVKESEERLRGFMNSATDGLALYDSEMRLLDANPTVLKRFPKGTKKEDLIGRKITELYPGFENTVWHEAYLNVLKTGKPYYNESYSGVSMMKNRIMQASAFKVGTGFGVVSRDITERRRLEVEAAEVKKRLDTFINASDELFLIYDRNLNLVMLNESALVLFPGKPREELIGKNIIELAPCIGKNEIYQQSIRVLETGNPIRAESDFAIPGTKRRLYDQRFFKVGDGLGVIATDITERKQLEEEAEASRERLKSFMDSATDGFSIWDSELRLLDANEAWMRRWPDDFEKDDLIGKRITELYPGVENSPRYEEYLRVMETGEPYSFEGVLAGPLVRRRVFSGHVFRVGDGLGMTSSDITDKKDMEERLRQAERIEAVSQMSAMIAHDLRGPLSTINQAAEMIKKSPKRSGKMLTMIKNNTIRALNMIEEIRIGTKKIEPKFEETDLAAMITATSEETRIPETIKVGLEIGDGLEAVRIDPSVIRRALDNLVLNAVEAMPNGGTLTLKARKEGGQIRILVCDTGTGIPDEALPRIFETFHSTKSKGLGLGLPYCSRAVEAHGGTISFMTKKGEGTTFTMIIPAEVHREGDNTAKSN